MEMKMGLNIEVLLLGIGCSLTLLAYMVAINAHGSARLSISFFLATLMLATNVWGVIQYVNNDRNKLNKQQISQLEAENRLAAEKILQQENSLKVQKEELEMVAQINPVVSTGTQLAYSGQNINLQDETVEVDALITRAVNYKKTWKS